MNPYTQPNPGNPSPPRDEGMARIKVTRRGTALLGAGLAVGAIIGNPLGGNDSSDAIPPRVSPDNPAVTTTIDARVDTLGDPTTTTVFVPETLPTDLPITSSNDTEPTHPTTTEAQEDSPEKKLETKINDFMGITTTGTIELLKGREGLEGFSITTRERTPDVDGGPNLEIEASGNVPGNQFTIMIEGFSELPETELDEELTLGDIQGIEPTYLSVAIPNPDVEPGSDYPNLIDATFKRDETGEWSSSYQRMTGEFVVINGETVPLLEVITVINGRTYRDTATPNSVVSNGRTTTTEGRPIPDSRSVGSDIPTNEIGAVHTTAAITLNEGLALALNEN